MRLDTVLIEIQVQGKCFNSVMQQISLYKNVNFLMVIQNLLIIIPSSGPMNENIIFFVVEMRN